MVSAKVEPFPGSERTLASVLKGLGFRVFQIDGTFMIHGSEKLWEGIFTDIDPLSREVIIPAELADMATRIVFLRPKPGTRAE